MSIDITSSINGIYGGAGTYAQTLAQVQRQNAETESFQSALEKARESGDDADLRKACRDFESYFIQIMFREMRKTDFSGANSVFGGDRARDVFQDMLDEEYSKSAANSGGIGLAEMLYKQMKRTNGV